jgi:hypothetical protein
MVPMYGMYGMYCCCCCTSLKKGGQVACMDSGTQRHTYVEAYSCRVAELVVRRRPFLPGLDAPCPKFPTWKNGRMTRKKKEALEMDPGSANHRELYPPGGGHYMVQHTHCPFWPAKNAQRNGDTSPLPRAKTKQSYLLNLPSRRCWTLPPPPAGL